MALAYGKLDELSHQLRFLLFETGIGLSQNSIDYFIKCAHQQCLQQLQQGSPNEYVVHHFNESIAHRALTLAFKHNWQERLKKETRPYNNFWQGLTATKSAAEILLLLDQWSYKGDTIFQHRQELSRRELMQYSPQFNAKVSLHCCALKKTSINTTDNNNQYQNLFAKHFPKHLALWEDKLKLMHHHPDDYYLIPIHPWQWRNKIMTECSSLIDEHQLILIPHHLAMYPSMSFETMMPTNSQGCFIKLQATTNEEAFLSEKIHQELDDAKHFDNSLFVSRNIASLKLEPSLNKSLSAQLQQHPGQFLEAGEIAVPLSALFNESPLQKTALLIEIIETSHLNPIVFFKTYCQILLSGQLQLMVRKRLVLSGDQHNTLVVFCNQRPRKIIFRETKIKTANMETLHQEFLQSNLINNLAKWISIISNHYQIDAKTLWTEVDSSLKTLMPNMLTPHDHIKQEQQSVLKPLQRTNQT